MRPVFFVSIIILPTYLPKFTNNQFKEEVLIQKECFSSVVRDIFRRILSIFADRKHRKMKIEAIFFDIDGTLVSFNTHTIPPSTIEVIKKVRRKGVKVFIATGRPKPFINNLGDLEYDGILSFSGACCEDNDGNVLFQENIDRSDLLKVITYHKEHPIPIAFASEKEIFITSTNETTKEVYTLLDIKDYGKIRPIEDCLDINPIQIIAFFEEIEEKHIMEKVLPDCEAFRWHPAFADIVKKGVSKATGISRVLSLYNMPLENVMAFGDGGNDIAMLDYVPHSVAMGNANEEVKRHARYTTDTIDNDGVAKMLEKTILN